MAGHGRCCDDDHNHEDSSEMGIQYSLYLKIDKANLECLNEAVQNSGKTVFKPWEERLSLDTVSEVMLWCFYGFNSFWFSVWNQMQTRSCYLTFLSLETWNLRVLSWLGKILTRIPQKWECMWIFCKVCGYILTFHCWFVMQV